MTYQPEENLVSTTSEEDFYKDTVEDDGLAVSVDEETDTITFSWNEDTHPQWNFLKECNKEELIDMMYKQFGIVRSNKDATEVS